MNRRVFKRDAAGPVRQVDACLFRHRRGVGEDQIGKVDRIRAGCWCRGERRHRPNRRALGRSLANEAHWLADWQAMDVGGCLRTGRKRSDKLVERDQVSSISSDRGRSRSRRLVEHDQSNGDPRPSPPKHLLQPDVEEQRRFVMCLGESGSSEAIGHDGDYPRAIGNTPDHTAQVTQGGLTILSAFLAAGERRVHQDDRRNRAKGRCGPGCLVLPGRSR